jgi:hypothetical protein
MMILSQYTVESVVLFNLHMLYTVKYVYLNTLTFMT